MFYKEILKKSIQYYDTLLISTILSIITVPTLWYLSGGNTIWVISCSILWSIGIFIIFQPTIRYIFPYMLTQIGTIALIFIIALLSILLNSIFIMTLLPEQDIDEIINLAIFSSNINNIFLFIWFYILVAITMLMNLNFKIDKISQIFSITLLEYFIEIFFIFILPIVFLFLRDITYSSRILLGVISVGVGLSMFMHKLVVENMIQKVASLIIYLIVIFIINSTIINSFSIDKIPSTDISARIGKDKILLNMEAKNIEKPLFQLSNNPKNGKTDVYKIVASIPIIGLNLGYRVATIPNREFTIKSTDAKYTVYDEYNNQKLLILDK